MTLETEVKFYIPQQSTIKTALNNAKAVQIKPRVFERNIRYDEGTLTANGIVLRLRQDDRVRLTYKEDTTQVTTGARTRLELETEIADFDTMDAILRKLGYATSMIYEKYRTTYALHSAEIVLDEMPYGIFIEIEGEPDAIEACVNALQLAHEPRIMDSYAGLFERAKSALQLDFRDLTFDNFANLDVPSDIFTDH